MSQGLIVKPNDSAYFFLVTQMCDMSYYIRKINYMQAFIIYQKYLTFFM